MKKLFALCAAVSVMLSVFVPGSAAADSGPAETPLSRAVSLGIVPKDLQADYQKPVTRAEFCHALYALNEAWAKDGRSSSFETLLADRGVSQNDCAFSDTDDEIIRMCAALHIVKGVGENRFDPGAPLMRQEAAVMLFRAAEALTHLIIEDRVSDMRGYACWDFPHVFSDGTLLRSWARNEVMWAYRRGVMEGTGQNRFDPDGSYTREQAFVTMLRLFYLNGAIHEGAELLGKPETEYYPLQSGYADNFFKTHPEGELSHVYPFTEEYQVIVDNTGVGVSAVHIIDKNGDRQLTGLYDTGGVFRHAEIYGSIAQIETAQTFPYYAVVNLKTGEAYEKAVVGGLFDGMQTLSMGYAAGYLNAAGELAVPMRYAGAGDFRDGRAIVIKRAEDNLEYVVIDKAGNELFTFDPGEGRALVSALGTRIVLSRDDDRSVAVYDAMTGFVTDFVFSNATLCENGQFIGGKNGYYALYSSDGRAVSKTYESALRETARGRYLGFTGAAGMRTYAFLDEHGRELHTVVFGGPSTEPAFDGGGLYAYMKDRHACVVIDHFGDTLGVITSEREIAGASFVNGLVKLEYYDSAEGYPVYFTPGGKALPFR